MNKSQMKLIVGLGNPGIDYKNTRHNIGFMFVDSIVQSLNGTFKLSSKLKSQICIMKVNGEDICFCKPMTYMNLSGEAVKLVMKYYDISLENILVIQDDLDLPVGKIRIRERGSHGGHNGMRSIMDNLQTSEIRRIKIGIDKGSNVVDYVLGKFNAIDMEKINETIALAPNIFNDYQTMTFINLMSRYN